MINDRGNQNYSKGEIPLAIKFLKYFLSRMEFRNPNQKSEVFNDFIKTK